MINCLLMHEILPCAVVFFTTNCKPAEVVVTHWGAFCVKGSDIVLCVATFFSFKGSSSISRSFIV